MLRIESTEYTVVDIETTGLSKNRHAITEIAAVKFLDGKVVGEFQSLVNPETHIPSFITRLTGIDDSMVADAPTIDKVIPEFLDFLGNSVIVAHNATFDYGFLQVNAEKFLGSGLSNEKLCTRKLANRLLPDLHSKRLSCLCQYFDIENEQAHRAMGDVRATAQVFEEFLEMMSEKGFKSKEDVQKFESRAIRQCREIRW